MMKKVYIFFNQSQTMKKTKTEQKSENEFYSFFENEFSNERFTLAVAGNSELNQTVSAAARFESQADKYFGYFKKIFSFVPGILFLHFAVPATIEFGFGIWGVFFFLAGSFMVWAGIGDLKNKNHWLLPLSVILTALLFSFPFAFLPINFVPYYLYFYACVLPLLFAAPILAKGLIDKYEENEN